MSFRSSEAQKAYDAGYKQALFDALKIERRFDPFRKIGGPAAPYKQTPEWKREHGG